MKKYIIFCLLANTVNFVLQICVMGYIIRFAVPVFLLMVLLPILGYFLLEKKYNYSFSAEMSEAKNAALLTLCQILIWCAAKFAVFCLGIIILGGGSGKVTDVLGVLLWMLIGIPFSSAFIVLMPLIKGIRLLARGKD